jgi:two-component system nitrogen regulation sensor histidine kinase NtrY
MTSRLKGQARAAAGDDGPDRTAASSLRLGAVSVTSGVVGLDPAGRITFANRSALRLLAVDEVEASALAVAVPEFEPLLRS